jgi:alkylation response protein AidB-like acyl-CoA dehydrogenase
MTDLPELLAQIRAFRDEHLLPLEPLMLQVGVGAILPRLAELRGLARELGIWAPHLPPLAAGEIRSAYAMTEPEHAGSNPVWLSTTAVHDGNEYVLNGHKWFVTGFEGADFVIVMAVTNPQAPKLHQRASQIIVPRGAPGVEHVRKIKIMGEEGDGWASHSELRFVNCRVPTSNLIGAEGSGFALAQERLGPGRVHHCMRWIGICERAFDLMCAYAATRELAPGKPAEINAARLLVMDTAHKIETLGAHGARVDISLIKFYVANVLNRVLDSAIQVHGGLGVTDDTMLAFWYRHERAARIYDGADEVHKTVVARQVMKAYGVDISILA